MNTQTTDTRVLLHLKYVSDELAAHVDQTDGQRDPVPTGASLLVQAHTLTDGRTAVTGSVTQRFHARRASGKVYRRWAPQSSLSIRRTKQDLIIARRFDPTKHRVFPTHIFEAAQVNREITYLYERFVHGLRMISIAQSDLDVTGMLRCLEGSVSQLNLQRRRPWRFELPTETETQMTTVAEQATEHIGEITSFASRFPLLAEHAYGYGRRADVYMPWLDAQDTAQVAKNLFGVTRYRKPLAKEIQRLGAGEHLSYFRLFRGLVPVDWIIEAMGRFEAHQGRYLHMTAQERTSLRAILRATPQPVLRRILMEPVTQSYRVLLDAARAVSTHAMRQRDLTALPELIAARGQKRIRSSRDLEHIVTAIPMDPRPHLRSIVRSAATVNVLAGEKHELTMMDLYNETIKAIEGEAHPIADWTMWRNPQFRNRAATLIETHQRALMDAREREYHERQEQQRLERLEREQARARWAADLSARLHGLTIHTGENRLRIAVASDATTLSQWGQLMNNCIGNYARDLGLDVFTAVLDADGDVVLNVQITQQQGITQFLGKNNTNAVRALGTVRAQAALDAFLALGVRAEKYALGTDGLHTEQVQVDETVTV